MNPSKLHVLFEDNHLIIVNKPPGILSQGDKTGDTSIDKIVKAYLKIKYNKPGEVYLGIPHRLDRPVGGVMVLARTSKAHVRMTELFRERKVDKEYVALVDTKNVERTDLEPYKVSAEAKLPVYRLHHFLQKNEKNNVVKCFDQQASRSKEAILEFRVGETRGKRTSIHVFPKTGRPHQIRVQLANIGLSIAGDLKYGYPKANADKNICLASKMIAFIHPVKKEPLKVEINIPAAWKF